MKKILTTIGVLGLFAVGASAQRSTDVEAIWVGPTPGTYAIPCDDSFNIGYIYINRGPEVVLATDTFFYYGPFTPSGQVNYTTHGNVPVAVNDTITAVLTKVKRSQLQLLADPTTGNFVYTPFANGDYVMFTQAQGFYNSATPPANVLEVADEDNASAGVAVSINCSTSVGINDANFTKTALTVYPNPATSQINFNVAVSSGNATVRIMDLSGRTVMTKDFGKQVEGAKLFTVDVASLPQGMYFVELTNGANKAMSKVTIK